MGDSFKPIVEGMDFCNIDGTGWPLSVCVSNGGDTLNGGYECRDYVPERTCRNVGGDEWGFKCSECGGHTHGSPLSHPRCGARGAGRAVVRGTRREGRHHTVDAQQHPAFLPELRCEGGVIA